MNGLREIATAVLVIALVGFVAWLLITYVPMMPIFRTVVVVALVVMVCIWLIRQIPGWPGGST